MAWAAVCGTKTRNDTRYNEHGTGGAGNPLSCLRGTESSEIPTIYNNVQLCNIDRHEIEQFISAGNISFAAFETLDVVPATNAWVSPGGNNSAGETHRTGNGSRSGCRFL